MPVFPAFKIQINNPDTEDLSGFPFPIKIPRSVWGEEWNTENLDNMNLGSDGYIIKWLELDDFWALAKLDTAYPEDIYAYYGPEAGCDPEDVFPIWRELVNEDIDNEAVGALEEGMTIISHSTNITGNHLIVIVNNSNGQAFVVHRNYFTNETYYTYFGEDNPSTTTGIFEKMSFAIKDGFFEIKWFDDEEGEWQDFISGLSLQEATVLVSGNFLNGRIYTAIQELPEGVTYDFYNYDTEEQYPWAPGEAPWDTSNPSIDAIEAPEKVISGGTFHVEATTTDIESLDFIFGGETYPGVDEGEGVFSADIEAPLVEEKTWLFIYAQSGDTTASKAIQIYPAVPVETRVKFFQNNSEISTLVMETGQTAFIDVLVEKKEDEWEEVGYQLEASIVSFDGQEFEEMAICNVDGRTVRVEADLPIGVYFLQTVIQLDPPLSYERVQRLKLKVVVDRK